MSVPSLGNSPTKENILEILSKEWPLSAKKIYNRLSKNISLTYQATHKALQELIEKKIVEKTKEGYKISNEWVENISDFSANIKTKLQDNTRILASGEVQKFIFTRHRNFIKFHVNFIEDIIKKEKNLKMTFHFRHVPYPHVLSNEEINKLKPLMPKIKWTILSKKSTVLDAWNAGQWKKMGVKVVMGAEVSADRRIIMNDYIMDAHMSKEALESWDKMYSIKNFNDLDVNSITESIFNKKFTTIVTIVQDKELAKMLHGKK